MARALDDVCCEGSTTSVRWWRGGLVNACGWIVSECCTGVASIRDARDRLVQIEGEKIAFDDHLQVVAGRVAKLNVKSGQKAIQGLAGDNNALPGR